MSKGAHRRRHLKGCPKLSDKPGAYRALCTCPKHEHKGKRPESKAWDTANTRPDLGLSTGVDGCYVQPVRKLYDKE